MTKNQFRILIVSSLLVAILAEAFEVFWPDPVLVGVNEIILEYEEIAEGWGGTVLVALISIGAVLAVASFVGMLMFRPWSRPTYLISLVLAFGLSPFLGATVYSGISQTLFDLSTVISGAILALIYYSPIADFFNDS